MSGRLDEVETVEPGKVIIRDAKRMGVYEAQKGLDASKEAQANLYGHLYREMNGVEVVGLEIVGTLRDWSKTQVGKRWAVVKPGAKRAVKLFDDPDDAATWIDAQNDSARLSIERRESSYPESQEFKAQVPIWDEDRIEAFMLERLRLHLAAATPPCSDEETWGGRRCKSYCDVAGFCPQFNKEKSHATR